MRSKITYIACLAVGALLAAGCRRSELHAEDDRIVRIVSQVAYEPAAKSLALSNTPLTAVRFLKIDGTAAPTDFTSAALYSGNRSAEGVITWQGSVPTYGLQDQNAYFVAYHPVGTETAKTKTDWTIDGATDLLLSSVWDGGNYTAPKTGAGEGETPLTLNHILARLEVVFQAEKGVEQATLTNLFGKITGVKFAQALPTATYTYATNAVTFGGAKTDLALRQPDFKTAFASIDIPATANTTINAAGLFAPTTGVFTLVVATEKQPSIQIAVQLVDSETNKDFEAGKKHTVTVQFNSDQTATVVNTTVAPWGNITTSDTPGGGAGSVVHTPTANDYVEIGGLRWAKGNLVAASDGSGMMGCKVGKPEDGGLYFQFGSLIGWKGGAPENGGTGVGMPTNANNTCWGDAPTWSWANDAMVWPAVMTGTPGTWPVGQYANQWFFGYGTGVYSTTGRNIREYVGYASGALADKGVGDPCSYYLGGEWRLPTANEIITLCNNQTPGYSVSVPWSSCNASWTTTPAAGGNFVGTQLFLPASGNRNFSNGWFSGVNAVGDCWSGSVYDAMNGLNLGFLNNTVYPQSKNKRTCAYPVRCVEDIPTKPTPPTESDYIEIDGLKWAKGNLVAAGGHNAKIGAPTDGGLYFQFGSLIGYKGGNQANGGTGVGMPQAPLTTDGTFWNGSGYSWVSEAMVWPSELVGVKAEWNRTVDADISTLSDYYFNYSVAPWEAQGQNIRDFAVSISGDKGSGTLATGRYAKQGVGDPCTYYLGGTWRLPTTDEFAALCNDQKDVAGWVPWATVGGSWTTTPTYGGNFYSNQLFFPASGYRFGQGGSFNNVTTDGNCWSSSVNRDVYSFSLGFSQPNNGVIPQYGRTRSNGFPVRCVSGELNYVEVNGVKWAKGNLVASNVTAGAQGAGGCKIGAPTDGGLYFQFGSLIGYKGGAQTNGGTGVGMPQAPLTTNGTYWNGTGFTWASDAMVWPTEMTSNPSSWPNNNGSTAGNRTTVVDQWFFNFNTAPYSNEGQDIRGFSNSFAGDKGSGTLGTGRYAKWGIGDPCTYYLGDPWRLPTGAEYAAMCNNKTAINTDYSWADAGGSWTTSPTYGGNFYSNKLFFPASGSRHLLNGSFNYVTASGYYWSSSVYDATGSLTLGFYSSRVYPQYYDYRSNGFPVRCVSSVP